MNRDISDITADIAQSGIFKVEHRNKLNQLGFEVLSDLGADRIVLSSGTGTVVKIARNELAIDKNYDEVAVWEKENNEELFCPIVDSGPHYTWIEMKLCSRTPGKLSEYMDKLENSEWIIPDIHAENIGICLENENLVCFDYPGAIKMSNKSV